MSAHTFAPGPWTCGVRGWDILDRYHRLIGVVSVRTDEAANASLITAAPDLYAALLASEREYRDMDEAAPLDPGCVQCTDNTTPHDRDTGLCAHHLRVAAIRKAGANP